MNWVLGKQAGVRGLGVAKSNYPDKGIEICKKGHMRLETLALTPTHRVNSHYGTWYADDDAYGTSYYGPCRACGKENTAIARTERIVSGGHYYSAWDDEPAYGFSGTDMTSGVMQLKVEDGGSTNTAQTGFFSIECAQYLLSVDPNRWGIQGDIGCI